MHRFLVFSLLALLPAAFAALRLHGHSSCPVPQVNDATISLIKLMEGWRAAPYQDTLGQWTIGYGHLCDQSTVCEEIKYPIPLSDVRWTLSLAIDMLCWQACTVWRCETFTWRYPCQFIRGIAFEPMLTLNRDSQRASMQTLRTLLSWQTINSEPLLIGHIMRGAQLLRIRGFSAVSTMEKIQACLSRSIKF
jgi:hypothetical protein